MGTAAIADNGCALSFHSLAKIRRRASSRVIGRSNQPTLLQRVQLTLCTERPVATVWVPSPWQDGQVVRTRGSGGRRSNNAASITCGRCFRLFIFNLQVFNQRVKQCFGPAWRTWHPRKLTMQIRLGLSSYKPFYVLTVGYGVHAIEGTDAFAMPPACCACRRRRGDGGSERLFEAGAFGRKGSATGATDTEAGHFIVRAKRRH